MGKLLTFCRRNPIDWFSQGLIDFLLAFATKTHFPLWESNVAEALDEFFRAIEFFIFLHRNPSGNDAELCRNTIL